LAGPLSCRTAVFPGNLGAIGEQIQLAASDVPFGRLHRRVTKEKLSLLEFAEGKRYLAAGGEP